MSHAENKHKQRIVGAIVLVALAVTFIPMLFSDPVVEPEMEVLVNVPPRPVIPPMPEFAVEEVEVPIPEPIVEPVDNIPEPVAAPAPAPAPAPAVKPGIDKNNLPVSWSIQLASLSKEVSANKLRDDYRKRGYKAYVRPEKGSFKVMIGPFIRQADAQRDCEKIKQREKNQNACFTTRYRP